MASSLKTRRDSIKKRLRVLLKQHSRPAAVAARKGFGLGISGPVPSIEDPVAWASRVREILTLDGTDKAVKKAFETFDLDPGDPRNWVSILNYLARVLEPELEDLTVRRKRGAKKKWTREVRFELVSEIERVRWVGDKRLTDPQACKRVANESDNPRIRGSKISALVKQAVSGRRQPTSRARGSGASRVLTKRKKTSALIFLRSLCWPPAKEFDECFFFFS